jgi:hypothetical protein
MRRRVVDASPREAQNTAAGRGQARAGLRGERRMRAGLEDLLARRKRKGASAGNSREIGVREGGRAERMREEAEEGERCDDRGCRAEATSGRDIT